MSDALLCSATTPYCSFRGLRSRLDVSSSESAAASAAFAAGSASKGMFMLFT